MVLGLYSSSGREMYLLKNWMWFLKPRLGVFQLGMQLHPCKIFHWHDAGCGGEYQRPCARDFAGFGQLVSEQQCMNNQERTCVLSGAFMLELCLERKAMFGSQDRTAGTLNPTGNKNERSSEY